LDSFLFSLWAR